jgi:VWFA-related protein
MARLGLRAVIGLSIAFSPSIGVAQQEPFRTATRLVEVHVVVTDRSRKPVPDLTRGDFTVTEDGVPQTVSIFEVRDVREPAAIVPVTPPHAGAEVAVSNQTPGASGSRTVLLLDRANAAFDSQWFARKHVDAYLSRMQRGDTVALYVLDSIGMRVLHDFSGDAASLRRAIDVYQARVTGVYDASNEPPANLGDDLPTVWIVDPSTAVSEFFNQQRWRGTFRSLRALAGHLSGVAGRKNVVWVSEVFPVPTTNRSEFTEEMRLTTRALNDAQAVLYPVDARGLMGAITYSRGHPRFTTLSMVRGNQETMEVVAEDTGGRAFMNTNALDVSIARAVDDSRLSYVLGYYSTDPKADGRFRAIRVEVKRKELTVRHRGGYVAAAPALDRKVRDAALREALAGPLAATQVGLSADLDYDKPDSTVTITLRFDPSTVASVPPTVDLLVAEIARTGKGTIVERAAASADALPLMLTVRVTPYLHELRIVARDPASGRVGSLVVPASRLLREGSDLNQSYRSSTPFLRPYAAATSKGCSPSSIRTSSFARICPAGQPRSAARRSGRREPSPTGTWRAACRPRS